MTEKPLFTGTLALVGLWALGQFARDRTLLTGLCFYIPSPFLAILLLGWATFFLARRRLGVGAAAACLALAPLSVVLFVENHFAAARGLDGTGPMRLVHWNVAGGLSAGARNLLVAKRAQIYVLSEIPDAESVEAFRLALGEEYRSQVFGNLAVISDGDVMTADWLIGRRRTKARLVQCVWERHDVQLLIVDLPSQIHIRRDPLLREINRLIEQHRPDLVVGDFNAPRRSRALCELPAGYRHAYDTAGRGCGYTWPVPVPMYAIDQCLYSDRIVPLRYDLDSSIHSDHRLQILDFDWNSEFEAEK